MILLVFCVIFGSADRYFQINDEAVQYILRGMSIYCLMLGTYLIVISAIVGSGLEGFLAFIIFSFLIIIFVPFLGLVSFISGWVASHTLSQTDVILLILVVVVLFLGIVFFFRVTKFLRYGVEVMQERHRRRPLSQHTDKTHESEGVEHEPPKP